MKTREEQRRRRKQIRSFHHFSPGGFDRAQSVSRFVAQVRRQILLRTSLQKHRPGELTHVAKSEINPARFAVSSITGVGDRTVGDDVSDLDSDQTRTVLPNVYLRKEGIFTKRVKSGEERIIHQEGHDLYCCRLRRSAPGTLLSRTVLHWERQLLADQKLNHCQPRSEHRSRDSNIER